MTGPLQPRCRANCGEELDWDRVDREDATGLHPLCVEVIRPAVTAGPDEAALALLRDKLGAEVIGTMPSEAECDADETGGIPHLSAEQRQSIVTPEPSPAGPCTDPWCAKRGNPCGFDTAEHIKAHGPKVLIDAKFPGAPMVAEPAAQPGQTTLIEDPNGGCCGGWIGPDKQPVRCQHCPELSKEGTGNDGATDGGTVAPGGDPNGCLCAAPGCWQNPCRSRAQAPALFAAPAGDHPLKQEMIRIIRWYDDSRPRSMQRAIGPSEAGVDCLRRLAYGVTMTASVNTTKDPWFAIVGTSVHAYLADALTAWNSSPEYGGPAFQIEQRVTIKGRSFTFSGSTDLYRNGLVGDHKILGPDALKKLRNEGPSNQYRRQVQTYGLGWEQAGWPVDTVAILGYPRSGYLDGMHVWSEPYNRELALDTLDRLASVQTTAFALGPAALPAHPDRSGCVFCPFFRPGGPADMTGCPGK